MNEREFRSVKSVISTLHNQEEYYKLLKLLNEIMGRYDE
jgi:hypothetical protein